MSSPAGKLMVLAGEKTACIKIAGRANFMLGIDFQALLSELYKGGYNHVVMDLSDCVLMDSTFLGILTGFGIKMTPTNTVNGQRIVELLNPNARVSDLLENLGVLHLFKICTGEFSAPEPLKQSATATSNADQSELTRTCLEAHRTLMSLSSENAARFKDVALFLSEELKKHKTGT
jgi:anti-sigma B factor antagonist